MLVQAELFEPHLSLWLVYLAAKGRSSSTLDCYRRDIRDGFAAMFRVNSIAPLLTDLCAIGQNQIDEISSYWSSGTTSDTTIIRRLCLAKLRTIFEHGVQNELGDDSQCRIHLCVPEIRPPIEADEALMIATHETGD